MIAIKPFRTVLLFFFAVLLFVMPVSQAEAGFVDRIKDIYEAPDRVQELQEQYQETMEMLEGRLEEQRKQLEESRLQAEELISRQKELQQHNELIRQENERYVEQNKALHAENQQLMQRMEEMEQNRKSLYRKVIFSICTFVVLVLSYTLSIRIWRFMVWRRQVRNGRGAMFP